MFAFRLLRSFATWFGAEWPKSILQAGYFAVTLAKSNMQDVPTTFQFTLTKIEGTFSELCSCLYLAGLAMNSSIYGTSNRYTNEVRIRTYLPCYDRGGSNNVMLKTFAKKKTTGGKDKKFLVGRASGLAA